MIKLAQRHLHIPQGDSGEFIVPSLIDDVEGRTLVAVFSIFTNQKRIWTKEYAVENGIVTISFDHEDTKNLPLGKYFWDIKIYVNPRYNNDGLLIDGDEVHSYYAGFTLPDCEVTLAPFYGRG